LDFTELSLAPDTTYEVAFGIDDADIDEEAGPSDYSSDRHVPSWSTQAVAAIEPNMEVFDNYLPYGGLTKWDQVVNELKSFCSGQKGAVSEYEQGQKEVANGIEKK
jgi:hypothetical protein